NLRKNAIDMSIHLETDHQRDRLIGSVDLDILFLAVVIEMKLKGLKAVDVIAFTIEDQDRRGHFLYGRAADDRKRFLRFLFLLLVLLLGNQRTAGQRQK